eukprot:XP_011675766.1 PREDICTED: uncharacterized protein LOC105443834 [Strongylocentrotus purpuratus]
MTSTSNQPPTSNPPPGMSFVYGIPQQQNDVCSSYLGRIKRTAIVQLIGGCLLVVLGIVAIILMAAWSYFATAIWSGILIFGATGVIGILAGNNGNKCLIRTYFITSFFGCIMEFAPFNRGVTVPPPIDVRTASIQRDLFNPSIRVHAVLQSLIKILTVTHILKMFYKIESVGCRFLRI